MHVKKNRCIKCFVLFGMSTYPIASFRCILFIYCESWRLDPKDFCLLEEGWVFRKGSSSKLSLSLLQICRSAWLSEWVITYQPLKQNGMGSLYTVVIYSKQCHDLDASDDTLQLLHSQPQQTGFCWYVQGYWRKFCTNKGEKWAGH